MRRHFIIIQEKSEETKGRSLLIQLRGGSAAEADVIFAGWGSFISM